MATFAFAGAVDVLARLKKEWREPYYILKFFAQNK